MKYDIFLSYSHLDRHIAQELHEKLKAGGLNCFLAEKSLQSGEEWMLTVRDAIRESERVLILITPRSVDSPWIYIETGAAWMEDKIVVPLIQFIDIAKLPEVIKNFQAKSIETETDKLNLIHEIINKAAKEPQIELSLDFIIEHVKRAKSEMDQQRFQPNLFIGSGRGGAIAASLFASHFGHLPLRVADFKFVGTGENRITKIDDSSLRKQDIADKNVLVVEWVRQTGKTFAALKDRVLGLHPASLQSYALFWTKRSEEAPDYYGMLCDTPPPNPWGIY